MPRISAPTLAEHQVRRRSAIIDAAVGLLVVAGPSGVTPAAVAASAGMARSSVYQYFPSSAALVAVAVEEAFEMAVEVIGKVLVGLDDPADRISAYLDATLETAIAGHRTISELPAMDLPPDSRDRILRLREAYRGPLVAALAELGLPDAEAQARLVMAVLNAAAEQAVEGEPVDEVRGRVRRFILAAVGVRLTP